MTPLRAHSVRRRAAIATLLLGSIVPAFAGAAPAPQNPPARGKTAAVGPAKGLLKLAEPWPDVEVLRARRVEAESRPLFGTAEPLTMTLTANFNVVNKDRSEKSTKRYPATLEVSGDGGRAKPLDVRLGTRGHFRLRASSCGFVPLRVEFMKEDAAGTVFQGQKALKLVTHCRNAGAYEQYTLREYLVYRIFNLLTPRSFRARLARVTYVDSVSGKPTVTRCGMFIEDDDDVARRMEGRIAELPNALFDDLDRGGAAAKDSLTLMALFEYMIANTDFSIVRLHNVRLIQDRQRALLLRCRTTSISRASSTPRTRLSTRSSGS